MPGGTHLYLDAPELSRLQMASAPSPSLIPIIIDGRCVGHLLNRGCMGVEVFDAAELSIGVFPSAPDVVATLLAEPSSRRRPA